MKGEHDSKRWMEEPDDSRKWSLEMEEASAGGWDDEGDLVVVDTDEC